VVSWYVYRKFNASKSSVIRKSRHIENDTEELCIDTVDRQLRLPNIFLFLKVISFGFTKLYNKIMKKALNRGVVLTRAICTQAIQHFMVSQRHIGEQVFHIKNLKSKLFEDTHMK